MQVLTALLGGPAFAVSGSADLETGARGMLLQVDGAFRLDALVTEVETVLFTRRLAGVDLRVGSYVSSATGDWGDLGTLHGLRPSCHELRVEIFDDKRRAFADIIVGAFRIPDRGQTKFVAQAIVRDDEHAMRDGNRGADTFGMGAPSA